MSHCRIHFIVRAADPLLSCRGLCSNHALTSLDLAADELDEYAGQELAHALLKNKTLTAINLTGNSQIPDEWLREHHKARAIAC